MERCGRVVLPVVVLAMLSLAGCGGEATSEADQQPRSLATAGALNSPLPTGWPTGVRLPAGSKIYNSKTDGGRLTVGFESQELANDVATFMEKQIEDAGFRRLSRKQDPSGLTANYTGDNGRSASFTLTDEGGTTQVDLIITVPAASGSPSATPTT